MYPTALPPIAGYHSTTLLDWPGRLAAIVFLPRCNFRCPFCHAGHLLADPAETVPLEAVLASLAEREGWLDGVVICGGEPTLWPALGDLCRRFRDAGVGVKLDTNGTRPDVLAALVADGLVDAVAMDVKAPLDARYARAAGVETVDLQALRRSIAELAAAPIEVEFRTTVVPALHEEAEIEAIGETLAAAGATGGSSAGERAAAGPGRRQGATDCLSIGARDTECKHSVAPAMARGGQDGPPRRPEVSAAAAGIVWTLQPFEPAGALDPAFRTVKPYPPDRLSALVSLGRRYVPRCRLRGGPDPGPAASPRD